MRRRDLRKLLLPAILLFVATVLYGSRDYRSSSPRLFTIMIGLLLLSAFFSWRSSKLTIRAAKATTKAATPLLPE